MKRALGLTLSAGAVALLVIVVVAAVGEGDAEPAVELSDEERRLVLQHAPLGPPPADPTNRFADDPRAAHLGQFLFFDPRLSGAGDISCATCHIPDRAFADERPLALGHGEGPRNTISLLNVAYSRWLFWDGRADTLWAQALSPMERAIELGGSRMQVARLIRSDPALRRAYEAIFGPVPDFSDAARFPETGRPVEADPDDPLHVAWSSMTPPDRAAVDEVFANVGKALAAYQRRLISRDAPFDRFAEGLRSGDAAKLRALTPAAQRGLKLFIGETGCTTCHSGPTFSDGEFHNTGVPPAAGGLPRDAGRYEGVPLLRRDPFNAAGAFSDDPEGPAARRVAAIANGPDNWGRFKTPTLRDVARTAPYMHQGQLENLGAVIHYYSTLEGALQLDHHREQILQPLGLSEEQQRDMAAFLKSLSGAPLPAELLVQPEEP